MCFNSVSSSNTEGEKEFLQMILWGLEHSGFFKNRWLIIILNIYQTRI